MAVTDASIKQIQQRLQPRLEGTLSLRDGGATRQLNTIYQRIGINGTEMARLPASEGN